MDVALINPFIGATVRVLETMAFTKAAAGKPYLKKDEVARGDVTGIVGLTGEVRGTLSVSFTAKSIMPIVTNMLGEEIKELNDEIKDAVGEITNMICGQARRKLEELGRSLMAAIPTVIMGENHTVAHVTSSPIIAIPFSTENGEFTIEVCFEK
ncbi:MAG: chemotaxis protein CheX [Desulfobacterales bacterium]|nr:chemotaxis protein CheX [Desulfobacterales bacterium]